MEGKDLGTAMPPGVAISLGTSTAAPSHHGSIIASPLASLNGTSEAVRLMPPDVTRPLQSTEPGHTPPSASNTALSSSHLNSHTSPHIHNMAGAIVPVPTGGFSFMSPYAGSGLESVKKKRGRPRKYGLEGSLALTVSPISAFAPSPSSPSQKRGRGRPPGSGKNQQLAALGELMLGSIGAGFTPHAITIATGEDIASRIMSFSQQGPRGICILSANGAISNVTLRQPSISGGIVTYEGRFEILSLSGSFLLTELGGTRSRTGGLSVSLAGPDGRVVGGSIAGVLIAASPVQVIVGSFLCNSKKLLPKALKTEASPAPTKPTAPSAAQTSPLINVDQLRPSSGLTESEKKGFTAEHLSPSPNKGPDPGDIGSGDAPSSDTQDKGISRATEKAKAGIEHASTTS
ncbi:hypothetical protein KP509_16G011500 [Ceratopteris richardii]|uniref:AT-hook motif nuclear-localized protein n=1 Tax=Ceratopteris richardii TaxID=49495 RepID=A0A8T2T090_CERRI|nr:hypothetical protein KP509_16G011500 [Ceratopteris richardii]